YGYIHRGQPIAPAGFAVSRFEEEPDAARAEEFVRSGEYLWNSGMFLFRASSLLAEMKHYAPDVVAAREAAMAQTSADMQFQRVAAAAFAASPSISVDYAVMEKTDKAAVVPLDARWSDIGSWSALLDAQEQ